MLADFVFDTEKYPNPQEMIDNFHRLGVRVILWATSLVCLLDTRNVYCVTHGCQKVDDTSPNYDAGCDGGYYLNGCRKIDWWHGHGSFIDYSCEKALDWWHGQMDNVLNLGIDGWKTDGTG